MEEKRRKYSISSDNSDTTDSQTTSASRCSKIPNTKSGWSRQKEKKPSEVFRTDLITAMKIPDSYQLSPDEYYILADPWRQEWEKGVQVPANTETIPEPVVRIVPVLEHSSPQTSPSNLSSSDSLDVTRTYSQRASRYDLDEIDACWLELFNMELKEMEKPEMDEFTLERVLEELETLCYENMNVAIETEEGLGIEYDEDVVCDVCRSPEGEDGNEMVFCDKCNVCVHQACYGILKVPIGNWLCRTCALGVQPKCLLCPKRGGALKPTRSGTKWVHVSCALWIPEVSIGCPEKMEPITKISHIPASRWALSCSLCKECTGTCIQCSMPSCITAFHVTCAFERNLDMRTLLAENDEVKFKSFCLEHSSGATKPPDEARTDADQGKLDMEKVTLRKQKLQQLEEDFYDLVKPSEVAENLDLTEGLVDFVYQYWKLKRKANYNKPLMMPKTDEVDNLAQQEQDVLYRRLKLFTHLRQDLERVRNLCYMVTRREKMKHSICKLQEQIFHLQMKLIEKDLYPEQTGKKTKGRRSDPKRKGRDDRKSSPEKKEKRKSGNELVLGQLGLSTSFPIDGTFFNSWLAQSVQITTENMAMSEWSLNNDHHEDTTPGLSEELLQDEETLLSFMMDHSLKSPLKHSDTAKKARSKVRTHTKKKAARNGLSTIFKRHQEDSHHWTNVSSLPDSTTKSSPHDLRNSKAEKGVDKLQPERRAMCEVKKSAKKGSSHPTTLLPKANDPHASQSLISNLSNEEEEPLKYTPSSDPKPLVKVPDPVGSPKTVVRFRLPKVGRGTRRSQSEKPAELVNGPSGSERSKVILHPFDNETDGYFSDAEMSDSDAESGSGRGHHSQLDSGNEDNFRMSILAS
ncbi:E3 ubiquitin-protein ligase Jade-2 isoform X1 [Zootoca vivipara]|uniref:E3 ubiquitin-protein ligase Jade-2 isoform X1 n=1 Tax=Zootoca vivipara TaxID=8524 RepID=UPI001590D4FB|nr:E3 ubiquitin-protein ligase Jade-2 isoform X1 [Zootoca vivipara]XP_034961351.1 E3 ubiquitin-protein ligase Jade-2 isoform X1 [Zootoca vivipara]XP_034961352.1 E3 ubiquitin-protein ligase Jade-2 isoform X1 [Zootoca vivipara]XP_034961354.1 E3 ubiquitin-protein ligase Jade-2 isoform X1 [Zootoca vivipara]XP_060127651.1 E3 ubiquitin-protein ligase Jade-2 isoform X1 [Zootoca vivipara]XP_060127652.1 E3 ubiquitin-protein ligase Jade-2 isoform X1 [Zootoca vivipara]XP_060127653.1 E3 ubiquitin-protein